MEYPRPWFSLDRTFLTRSTIEELRDQFGAAGPLAIIALIAEACASIGGGKKDGHDLVAWRYATLGRRIAADAAQAKAIVAAAAALGLVELQSEAGEQFEVRLLRWREWHAKDPGGAVRKANQREREHQATM